jgi:hypothetical protein
LNISDYTDFSGSATDLAALAIACGQDFGLPVDPDKTNERLVRYYASEGIIDRPDRVGRDAAYGYRHLLQLLTARRMLQAGAALSVIGPHNSTATTKALEESLVKPLPTAAELLVSSFLQSKRDGVPAPRSAMGSAPMASSAPSRSFKSAPPGPSIVDVLDEVRRIRSEWMSEIYKLQALQQPMQRQEALVQGVEESMRYAQDAVQLARATRQEVHESVHELVQRELHQALQGFQQRIEARWEQALERLNALNDQNDQILRRLDELQGRTKDDAGAHPGSSGPATPKPADGAKEG